MKKYAGFISVMAFSVFIFCTAVFAAEVDLKSFSDDDDNDEDVDIKDNYYSSDDDDEPDDDSLTEESYRTTIEQDPDDLSLDDAEEISDDEY